MLNIYNIDTANLVNGNGVRYVLWLQGCDLGCSGCWNKETWSFEKNTLKSSDEVFQDILKNKIDGVTFTGGEPFLQAKELSELANLIKSNTDLDIQIFTGFEKSELVSESQKQLLSFTDILVAGRFDNKKKNNNQKIYYLNSNIQKWDFNNSDIQIDISDNGDLHITGYPTDIFIQELKKDL